MDGTLEKQDKETLYFPCCFGVESYHGKTNQTRTSDFVLSRVLVSCTQTVPEFPETTALQFLTAPVESCICNFMLTVLLVQKNLVPVYEHQVPKAGVVNRADKFRIV